MLPQPPPVESTDTTQRIVIDPRTGTTTVLGRTEERAIVFPDGSHQVEKTDIHIATLDGQVLNTTTDVSFRCAVCNIGPWSKHAINACTVCKRVACPACHVVAPEGALCTQCATVIRRKTFWAWLRRIT